MKKVYATASSIHVQDLGTMNKILLGILKLKNVDILTENYSVLSNFFVIKM